MKDLVFIIYDAFGDWISANGMIRYLSEIYDKIILIHDTPYVVSFAEDMFKDNDKICRSIGLNVDGFECDVIDVRVNEDYSNPGNIGIYYNRNNKFINEEFEITDNASAFYSKLGFSPDLRITKFDYQRNYEKEQELYSSLNLPEKYSVICEMGENLIDKKYIKENHIINLHRLTDNFLHTLKIIENATEVHLIENSIALFVYHMQNIKKMKDVEINLHTYSRKEVHRKCDSVDCDNKFLNMLKHPKLKNWNFI